MIPRLNKWLRRGSPVVAQERLYPFSSCLRVDQLPGLAVGLGVGVAVGLVVGIGVGLGVGIAVGVVSGTVVGVGVPSMPVVGTTVGLEVGVAVVAGTPAVGVVSPPVAGLVFWFCVSVLPALKVALMATPFPSVVTATGSGIFNKPTQFSPLAPYLPTKPSPRKVKT